MGILEYLELFLSFFMIGLFSIGGGYAIIPLIGNEAVVKQGWITEKTFTDIITISQMTPGPIAVNTATFVGLQVAGVLGAITATVGCIISGSIISINLYRFFNRHKESETAFEVLKSLKASSLGLIISAGVSILLLSFIGIGDIREIITAISSGNNISFDIIAVIIFAFALISLRKLKLSPILIIVISGIAGAIVYS